MSAPLINAVYEWQRLKDELIAQFGEGDDDALADTLEGISDLPRMIERVLESMDADEAMAAALAIQIEQRTERMERYKDRAKTKRGLVEDAMIRADIRRLEFPAVTVSLGKRPRTLMIADESQIPAQYWTPQDPRLSKSMVTDALVDGIDVPGAALSNGSVGMNVRRK